MFWNTFSFQSLNCTKVWCALLSLAQCWGRWCIVEYFLKRWCVFLLPIRLADPRAWRAHLGMQTQGRAKFVSAVRQIIVHEYYNSRNYDYDIALLQLSKPWPETMSHIIQPICVPPFSHRVRSGDKCWITGWGQKQEVGEFNTISWVNVSSPGDHLQACVQDTCCSCMREACRKL